MLNENWASPSTSKRPSPSLVDEPQEGSKKARTQPIHTGFYYTSSGYEPQDHLGVSHGFPTWSDVHHDNHICIDEMQPGTNGAAPSANSIAPDLLHQIPQEPVGVMNSIEQMNPATPEWMELDLPEASEPFVEFPFGYEPTDPAPFLVAQEVDPEWPAQDLLPLQHDSFASSPNDEEPTEMEEEEREIFRAHSLDEPGLGVLKDTCNDYNTCFGVIIATAKFLYVTRTETKSLPVTLKLLESMVMIYDQSSGIHAGVLSDFSLANALNHVPLKLDGTLITLNGVEAHRRPKPKLRDRVDPKPNEDRILRIVLYGQRRDKAAISEVLSEKGFYLQQPCVTEVRPHVEYDNPHYFSRPGSDMPPLEDLHLDGVDDDDKPVPNDIRHDMNQNEMLRIFDDVAGYESVSGMLSVGQSPRLRTRLMSHQTTALAWMQEKEKGCVESPLFPALWTKDKYDKTREVIYYRHAVTKALESRPIPTFGGILADDMGLGKTLSVLALICASIDSRLKTSETSSSPIATLIVAPKSTIHNWVDQISRHINDKEILVHLYHGPGRESLTEQLRDADVVIITYETLRSDWSTRGRNGPMYSKSWLRVVLDEAHHIRNRSNQAFLSVDNLKSRFRWCLTGTPIHNRLDDYGALLSFIKCYPFMAKSTFKSWIESPMELNESLALDRLRALIRATCLRRTKANTLSSHQLKLPSCSKTTVEINLGQDQSLYEAVKKLAQEGAAGLNQTSKKPAKNQGQRSNIMVLINHLRLICNHGGYLLPGSFKEAIQNEGNSQSGFQRKVNDGGRCSNCDSKIDSISAETAIEQDLICTACASLDELPEQQASQQGRSSKMRLSHSSYQPSAKVVALLENLNQERLTTKTTSGPPRKSVVFTFWVKMLDLIEIALERENFRFQRIDGQSSVEARSKAMEEFNHDPTCAVMLATTGSCAEGVNLTAASTVHMMEPHWNPMQEAQAVDRVYRIGQTQEVKIFHYIVPGSVETYVKYVQDSKKQLISQAMNSDEVDMADEEAKRHEKLKEMLQ